MAETFWWAELFAHSVGIPSAEAFGLPQLTFGAVELSPVGIPTGEAFGATLVIGPQQFILPSGIESAEAFGEPSTGAAIIPTGIDSGELFGLPMVGKSLHANGIPSGEAFGEALFINPAKPEIVGFNISGGTTTTMPAHQAGDLLLVMAYNDGGTHPSIPSASGSVPAWVNVDNQNANTNAMRLAYYVATSNSHTTGTWSNSTAVAVAVIRGADPIWPLGFHSLGFGSASNQSVAPALPNLFEKTGRTQLVYVHAHKTVTSWGPAPDGFTRVGQVNTEMAVNTKDVTTTDGAATQTATTSSSAGYAGAIIEAKRKPEPGVTWNRYYAGSGVSNGSQQQYYAEGDRILLFMNQDRANAMTITVDGVALKRVALIQYDGVGTATLAAYLSAPLSEGLHTLAWSGGSWYTVSAFQIVNASGVCGMPSTVVDTGNVNHPVDAPQCAGGRVFHAAGAGSNVGFTNPQGGNSRQVLNNNAALMVSDWDDATTFTAGKSSSPQWAGLAIDLGPMESMDPNKSGPVWDNPPKIVDFGTGGVVDGTVDAVEGDTLIFDFVHDRGTPTPPAITMNGVAMPVVQYVNFTGGGANGILVRYIVENVPGGTLTFSSPSLTFGNWTAQASFVRNVTVGASATVMGSSSAPSQSVTLGEGEFAVQTFGAANNLVKARGGTQIGYSNDGAALATQVANVSTTFSCPNSQNHAGIVTKFS